MICDKYGGRAHVGTHTLTHTHAQSSGVGGGKSQFWTLFLVFPVRRTGGQERVLSWTPTPGSPPAEELSEVLKPPSAAAPAADSFQSQEVQSVYLCVNSQTREFHQDHTSTLRHLTYLSSPCLTKRGGGGVCV